MSSDRLSSQRLDIRSNRKAKKYSLGVQIARLLWSVILPTFWLSPRVLWGWRNLILRIFGAQIGRQVRIHPSVQIEMPWNLQVADFAAIGANVKIYNLGRITIGPSATISQGGHLCAGSHDYSRADMPLLKCTIDVGEGAWICADAFVGPNVNIGDFAILGARGVAIANVLAYQIVAGNPAKFIKMRSIANPKTSPSGESR